MSSILLALLLAAPSEWKTLENSTDFVIERRDIAPNIYEFRLRCTAKANPEQLQGVITDPDSFPGFMPHVKEARTLQKNETESIVYTLITPPFVKPRDYVVKVVIEEDANETGKFVSSWASVEGWTPERPGTVRLHRNEGSWDITLYGTGSMISYVFTLDTGGWIPGFVLNILGTDTAKKTIEAIEKEALRRRDVDEP